MPSRTFVLLLAFIGSDLTEDIEKLERVFRDVYGYNVCTYWIGGSTQFQKLDNVLLTFTSTAEYFKNQIILYYGGLSTTAKDNKRGFWTSDCGVLLHGWDPDNDLKRPGRQCAKCLPYINPTAVFGRLLQLTNDVLFIFHSHVDLCRFSNWAENASGSVTAPLFRPHERKRNVQFLLLNESATKFHVNGRNECRKDHSSSEKYPTVQHVHPEQPHATRALTDSMKELAQEDLFFTLADICEELEERDISYDNASILGSPTNFLFFSLPTKTNPPPKPLSRRDSALDSIHSTRTVSPRPPPSPIARPNLNPTTLTTQPTHYTSVHSLLLTWADVTNNSEMYRATLAEAFEYLCYDVTSKLIPEHHPWGGLDAWLGETVHEFTKKHTSDPDARPLFIIAYLGHGEVDGGALKGCRAGFRDKAAVDLSLLQASLRTWCPADVLLVLDCCDAGFVPPLRDQVRFEGMCENERGDWKLEIDDLFGEKEEADGKGKGRKGARGGKSRKKKVSKNTPTAERGKQYIERKAHTMETLAACPAGVETWFGMFSRKMAGELIMLSGKGPGAGLSVDELNTRLLHNRRGDEQAYSNNLRVLNCGGPSIMLPVL